LPAPASLWDSTSPEKELLPPLKKELLLPLKKGSWPNNLPSKGATITLSQLFL
jgi:hypothetical protein